jgi:hypothetical protein
MITKNNINGIEIITIENDVISFSVAPALGGKITSVFNKKLQKEFLWTNKNLSLKIHAPGSDYDSNFYGAIDELIPGDIPETVDGIVYPDHGELWTTELQYQIDNERITTHGLLPQSGLHYSKTVYTDAIEPIIYTDYRITNQSSSTKSFLWKLHAALKISEGDKIISSAKYGQVVDPAYSRFQSTEPFHWPVVENTDASTIPASGNTMDFFYLYNISGGIMELITADGHIFRYQYDTKIFPYQWLFASYGGFLDHYMAILEPCTNMPISVNEAKALGQSAVLAPGESLVTTVSIFAGEKSDLSLK